MRKRRTCITLALPYPNLKEPRGEGAQREHNHMNIKPCLALLDLKELLNPQWLGAINFGEVGQRLQGLSHHKHFKNNESLITKC